MKEANKGMRIVDLFSGAGGLTFGFYYRLRNNSFVRNRKNTFVFANEFDRHAATAFRANYPDIPMLQCDIKSLSEEKSSRRGKGYKTWSQSYGIYTSGKSVRCNN